MIYTGLSTAFALTCALWCAWCVARVSTQLNHLAVKTARFRTMQQDLMLLGADIERGRVETQRVREMHLKLAGQFTKRFGGYIDETETMTRDSTAVFSASPDHAPMTTLRHSCTETTSSGLSIYAECARAGKPCPPEHLDNCLWCRSLDELKRDLRRQKGLKSPVEIAKHAKGGAA